MSPNRSCAHNYSTSSPEPLSSSTRPAPASSPMVRAYSLTPRGGAHPRCTSPLLFLMDKKRIGGQQKTWASTIKDDLAALSGPQVVGLRRWNCDRLAILCDLAQNRRKWAAMVRDAVLAQEEAGLTRSGWNPIQVKTNYKRYTRCFICLFKYDFKSHLSIFIRSSVVIFIN